jgi:hypothetical protein
MVSLGLDDLQYRLEVIFPYEDLAFGVHVADPAVGRHDLNLPSSAGRLVEGVDYVVRLIGHFGYYGASPII